MKLCIACAEEIKAEALLCKHCGTRQDDKSFADEAALVSQESKSPNGKVEDGNLDSEILDIRNETSSDSGATATCTNCFAFVKPEWAFCDQCGATQQKSKPPSTVIEEPKSQEASETLLESRTSVEESVAPPYFPTKDPKPWIRSRAAVISAAVLMTASALSLAGLLSSQVDNVAGQDDSEKQSTVAPAAPAKSATPEPTYSDDDLFWLIAEQSTLELSASFTNQQQCGIDCISINGKLTLKPEYALREVLKRSLELEIDLLPSELGSERFIVPLVSEREAKFDIPPISLSWESYVNAKFEATLAGEADLFGLSTSLVSAKTTLYNFACQGLCQESDSDDNPLLPKFGQLAATLESNGYCDSMSTWNTEYLRYQQNCESDRDGVNVDLLLAERGLELYYQLNEATVLGQGWAFKSRSIVSFDTTLLDDLATISPFLVSSRCNVSDVKEPFDIRICVYQPEGGN